MCFHWRIYVTLKPNSPAVVVAVKASSLPATRGAKKDLEHFIKPCPQGVLTDWPDSLPGKLHSQGLSFFFFFNWRIIALQYCVGFCHTLTWIGIHVSPCPWTSLPLPTPSHPSRLSRSTGVSSLCHTAESHWLSVLIYMCYCYSLNLSHSLLPPEKAMTPHSSTLAWKIPWTEEPLSCTGEGNGNPLQCSCLENPRDGGAWWAAVYGVTQSQTRLKWLSSSSSSSPTVCTSLFCVSASPLLPCK